MTGIVPFPSDRSLEFPRQGDRREFVWLAVEGHPPGRAKRIILEARTAGIIEDADAECFLSAAGLEAA